MYETHLQDELVNRQEKLVFYVASGLTIILLFVFMLSNHLTRYLHLWLVALIIWGAFFGFFIFEWRFELRAKAITDLFPENRKWYPVKPRRHTNRRLSNRKYDVQRSGTTLRIRTVYSRQGRSECTIAPIEYETFKRNYVLMKEKSAT